MISRNTTFATKFSKQLRRVTSPPKPILAPIPIVQMNRNHFGTFGSQIVKISKDALNPKVDLTENHARSHFSLNQL